MCVCGEQEKEEEEEVGGCSEMPERLFKSLPPHSQNGLYFAAAW